MANVYAASEERVATASGAESGPAANAQAVERGQTPSAGHGAATMSWNRWTIWTVA